MEITSGRPWWDVGHESSFFRTLLLVCFVAILSYGASSLGAALVLRPQMLSALWPGCVVLVSVMLLVPRKTWPALIVTALAVFVINDRHNGTPASTAGVLALADTVEILIAALCLSYFFDGVPRLNSVVALAKVFTVCGDFGSGGGRAGRRICRPGELLGELADEFLFRSAGFPHADAGDSKLGRQKCTWVPQVACLLPRRRCTDRRVAGAGICGIGCFGKHQSA